MSERSSRRWRISLAVPALALAVGAAGCGGSEGAAPLPAESGDWFTTEPVPRTGAESGAETKGDGDAAPRTAVPSELVGEWDGDRSDYTFTPDGYVEITKVGQGTVEVVGGQVTFHVPGVPAWTTTWRITPCDDPAGYGYSFRMLFLDEYSYVQDC